MRGLRTQPGFTILAVMELGIGSVTTIFSFIDNVLLNPLPYADAQRVALIYIHDVKNSGRGGRSFFSTSEFLDYQEQNHVFDAVIGGTFQDVLYSSGEGTEQFDGVNVTPNLFRVLSVPALIGRGIAPEDDPVTLCSVVAVVAGAGLAACYFPARRATRVDPMVALRYQ